MPGRKSKTGPKGPTSTKPAPGGAGESLIHDQAAAMPAEPAWFNDPEKLLRAVMDRAEGDGEFARRVVVVVARFAGQNPDLASALRRESRKGKAGNPGTEAWKLRMVSETFRVLSRQQKRGARERALEFILNMREAFDIESRSGAERLLKKALTRFPGGGLI